MKKLGLLGLCLILWACSEDTIVNNNPYVPEMNVNLTINTTLPAYATLNYANNGILETSQGYNGIIVYNTGIGFVAFEATCSNHPINAQSALTINGQLAHCAHCESDYFLLNGQPTQSNNQNSPYFLRPYRINAQGNMLYITNF